MENNSVTCNVMNKSRIADVGENRRRRLIRHISFVILAAALTAGCVIVKGYFDGDYNSVATLQGYVEKCGIFGPSFLILFQAAQVVVPVLPGFLGCAVGSVLFGPAVGFLCNYIGISIGSIAAFFLSRKFGMPILEDVFPNGKYKKWSDWASRSRSYTAFLFAAMILPMFPDDYLCYLTGLSDMSPRKFITIIILGKPWCILAYSLGFSLIQ